jgi:hypothetical protein
VDVEDNESQVLAGAARVLAELAPVWLIEIHSAASLGGCVRKLRQFGYHITPLDCVEYYQPAIEAALLDHEPAAQGFRRGHILAVPAMKQ